MPDKDGNIWSTNERRQVVAPHETERGYESHPAWVLIGASRVSGTPGAVLFDSDIRHNHYVSVKIEEAERKRDLNHDYIHGRKRIIEIDMSEAQWASFVSSMNTTGVPATLRAREDDYLIPEMPYAPRLQVSMDEVHGAAEKAQAKVEEAFAAYKEHKTAANLRALEIAVGHITPNMDFVAKSLGEHAENVVTKARADIEAYVVSKANQLGLDPADLGDHPLELEAGGE